MPPFSSRLLTDIFGHVLRLRGADSGSAHELATWGTRTEWFIRLYRDGRSCGAALRHWIRAPSAPLPVDVLGLLFAAPGIPATSERAKLHEPRRQVADVGRW